VPGLLAATAWAASPALGRQHKDFPCGAIPLPPGNHVRDWVNGQALKAELDDFVLYKYEFCKGGEKLGPYGSAHIQMIARRLATVPFPVVVQATIDPQLNESRRMQVITALALAGVPNPEERVVIAFPEAEGMYGEEAEIVYPQLFATNPFGFGYGGFGGFGGGGGFGGFYGGFGGFGGGLFGGYGGFGRGIDDRRLYD
jgi:hypothetical protein